MDEHQDLLLIVQYLQSPEDPALQEAIGSWLRSGEGNEAVLREYERIWRLSAGTGQLGGIDAEAATRRFRDKLPRARTIRLPGGRSPRQLRRPC